MHQRQPARTAQVRVRVDVVGRAVGGPPGVPDPGRRLHQRGVRDRLLQVGELAGPLVRVDPPVGHEGDARGVVAPVLEAAQPLDDDTLRLLVSDIAHDSAHGRHPSERAPVRPDPRRLQQSPACLPHGWVPPRRSRGRRARILAVHRARPRHLGRAGPGDAEPAQPRGDPAPARARRRPRPRGGAGGLPAAVQAAQHVRRGGRQPAPAPGGLPPPAHPAADAVRDRAGRLGGRRQVHHRAGAAGDARALARAPQRRAGHHRRLPLPQRRARAARPAAPQGLPGVLRPPRAAALRRRHQVRQGRGGGADVLPPGLRRGARREGRDQAPGHRHHRGPQRAPARAGARGRPHRPHAERLLRLQRVRRRRHRPHPQLVRRALPAAARDRVPRPGVLLRQVRRAQRRGGDRRGGADLGHHQRAQPGARTCCPPARGPPWCCARTATTPCATCGSASSEQCRTAAGRATARPRGSGDGRCGRAGEGPAQAPTPFTVTGTLPRVALEYGHTWWAASTSSCAWRVVDAGDGGDDVHGDREGLALGAEAHGGLDDRLRGVHARRFLATRPSAPWKQAP